MLLAPALVALILADRKDPLYVAAAVFVAGAATDGLDGYVARRYATTTRTGQWLDPLADKVLVAAPILALASLGRFPWWAAVIIVVREILVSALRVVLGLRGRSLPASRGAKVKTTLQILAITLYILPLGSGAGGVKLAFLVAAVVMTVSTGALYAAEAGRWLRHVDRSVPHDGAGPE